MKKNTHAASSSEPIIDHAVADIQSEGIAASKQKALEVAFAQIDKAYGKGAVMLLGQSTGSRVSAISTGSILIDQAIGVGGLPTGRIIEIFGPEASGKTTLALQAISQSQRDGGICAFIDAEHALDQEHAAKLGINVKDLIISQPDYGEQALDIVEMLVRSGAIDIIVVDSVAALVPKAELEGDMGDSHMGLQARLMSQALRKLTPVVHKSKTVLIFINQIRQTMNTLPFANKETTTGGNALKFYASVRLDIRRTGSIKKGEETMGSETRVKVVKNKVAPPFRTAEFDILYNEGISRESEIINLATQLGLIEKAGAWYSYNQEKIGQGKENVRLYLKENTQLAALLEQQIRTELLVKKTPIVDSVAEIADLAEADE